MPHSSRFIPAEPLRIRDEIAAAAARMIAEDGLDYATAKRKAARQLLGGAHAGHFGLPDNDQIEAELRAYQAIFDENQPAVLRRLRETALHWMRRLEAFQPYLTGAVLNGTASEHSDIHLQVFCDNPKEVAIYLLNAHVQYDISETNHFAARGRVETLSFLWRAQGNNAAVGIHVALYDADDLRGAVRAGVGGRLLRASTRAVQALLDESRQSGENGNRGDVQDN
jgi:hypothetical protein